MRRLSLFILLAGAFAFAPTAAWASGVDVIRDCTDNGAIDDAHGPQDYADALSNLPSDVDEYTDCRQVISSASRNPPRGQTDGVNADGNTGSSGGGGGGGGSGGGSSSGSGGGSVKSASASGGARRASGPPVIPPAGNLASQPTGRGVPVPLIVTAVLIALALIAWSAIALRRRARGEPQGPVHSAGGTDRVFPRRA